MNLFELECICNISASFFFFTATYRPIIITNFSPLLFLRGEPDKSLARPGRKQATATKLGIYSTYSPWGGWRLDPKKFRREHFQRIFAL